MASSSATNQDTLVTLKINIEGSNRRFKLPLRDLGASTLPDKVRVGPLMSAMRLAA
jgi:next-to-BRCA1 protein 1